MDVAEILLHRIGWSLTEVGAMSYEQALQHLLRYNDFRLKEAKRRKGIRA